MGEGKEIIQGPGQAEQPGQSRWRPPSPSDSLKDSAARGAESVKSLSETCPSYSPCSKQEKGEEAGPRPGARKGRNTKTISLTQGQRNEPDASKFHPKKETFSPLLL